MSFQIISNVSITEVLFGTLNKFTAVCYLEVPGKLDADQMAKKSSSTIFCFMKILSTLQTLSLPSTI